MREFKKIPHYLENSSQVSSNLGNLSKHQHRTLTMSTYVSVLCHCQTSCQQVMQCVLAMLCALASPPAAYHTQPCCDLCHSTCFDPSRMMPPSSQQRTSFTAATSAMNMFSKQHHLVYVQACHHQHALGLVGHKLLSHMPMLHPLIARLLTFIFQVLPAGNHSRVSQLG